MTQYFTNFTEYTAGTTPGDWSFHSVTGGEVTVENVTGSTSGKALVINTVASDRNTSAYWDDVGTVADIEVVMRFRCPNSFNHYLAGVGAFGRGNGVNLDAYSARTAWEGFAGPNALTKGNYGGNQTEMDTASIVSVPSSSSWYWMRLRCNGTSIKAWFWTHGDTPKANTDTADCEITDSSYASGYAGITADFGGGFVSGTDVEVDIFGAGTGGDAAPMTSGGSSATQMAFTTQPANTVVGATLANVVVACQDGSNITDTSYTSNVVIALQTGSGTLTGTLTKAAVAGVATFNDLSIDTLNTGAVLRATSSGLTQEDSATFDIIAGSGGGGIGSLLGIGLVY